MRNKCKDFKGAIADLTRVIESEPENGDAYYERSKAYKFLNNEKKAKEDVEKAEKIGYIDLDKLFDTSTEDE